MRFSKFIIALFVSTLCFGQSIPAQNDLIGYYPFNGNTNDESGNNNHGVTQGSLSLISDIAGNSNTAYNFTGGEIRVNSGINLANSSFTISVMSKAAASDSYQSNPHFVSLGTSSSRNGLHTRYQTNGSIRFGYWNDDYDLSHTGNSTDWKHWTFVHDINSNTRKVYLNGSLLGSDSNQAFIGSGTFVIGNIVTTYSNRSMYWRGILDDVAVWNIALTDEQVSQNYTAAVNGLGLSSPNPLIQKTKIALNNSTVSVTFSEAVYGGTANATSTLEVSDFTLSMSGGSASLTSASPSSINVSGTTIGLGVPLTGTPDGSELLTVLPASNNSIFNVSGDTVSTTQTSNTTELIPNIITDNLLLYLDSRNKSSYPESGSIWYDLSGNNYNGNLQNTTSFSTDYNGILNFNGSSDWVELNAFSGALSNSSSYTILLHFKSTETNASGSVYNNAIFSMHNSGTNIFRLGAAPDSNKGLYYNIGTSDSRAGTNINLHNNTWRFAVISKDLGSNANFYIDNQLVSAGGSPGDTTNFNSVNQVSIGQEYDNSSETDHFQGSIPVVMVYNKALSTNEINQIYDALIDIPPSDISLSSNTISETASIGSVIGTLSATDSDTTINNLTFSLADSGDTQDDDNGSFTISGTSLLTSTTLDYETKTSYSIYLKVSDGTNDFAKAFTISVTNINEAPTDLGFGLNVIENGLIMYLDATNPDSRGTNQWKDLSGNGNHATVNGATLVSDSYYSLDGNDWFNWTTDVLTTDGPYTMQGFIKTTNTNWNGSNAFYNTYRSDKGIWWHFNTNGTLGWRHYGNGGTNGNLSGFNFVQNQWQMVTLTYDGSNLKLYIDKNYKSSANAGSYYAGPQNANSGATMGRLHSRNGDYSFHGQIRNKLIYNRALTQQEIENNFDLLNGSSGSGSGTTTSTASFDEGSAVGTVVATLTATDTDTTNLTYSLATGNGTTDQHNSLFTVSGTQLLIASSTISYDTTTSLNVNLQVFDGEYAISKAFQITVNDVNRAPTDIGLTSNTITENASPSTVIGTLSSVDSDTTDTTSFTLATSGDAQDDDNGSFTISGTSLILNSSPDYETKASYNIYINVNDGANNYAKAFTVSVTNVLEPITDLGFEVASIVTDGLILHLDASNSNSYSGSGNTWYDISGNNNHGTLNGPTFSNTGLKHFVFNGTDDVTSLNLSNYSDLTFEFWFYDNRTSGQRDLLTYNGNAGSFTFRNMNHFRTDGNGLSAAQYPTSLVSNQWVRFVYVKNTKIFINNTKTNISSGSDRTYGQLKIGDARSDVGQHWDGKIALVRIYNRSLTDQEIEKNYEVFDKVVNNNQQLGTSSSTVSVDEEVSAGTLVANLTATDSDTTSFTFSLVAGDGTNDRNNSSFTVSGTQLLVAGNIDYETNSSLNIYVQASDGTNTFAKALTVNVNDVNEPPVITATTLAQDNSSVDVTFSEAVNASADASNTLALEVSDFVLSLQGGTATLSATTPLSISANGNTYTLGLPLVGISDGTEVLTVQPASNAIYDLGAAVASTTQSSNIVTLNPPNAAPSDISLSSSAVNENVSIGTLVAALSTTDTDGSDTHTYSLVSGAGDTDNARFSINGVNLLTAAAVDYESQNSFSILLQTSDGTATYTESFTISVIDGEDDSDGDGIFDNSDAFPSDASEWSDNDGDGTGDNADTDDDNDGWSDTLETSCNTNPLSSSETPSDFDQDGNPDCLDPDDDNDTYPDLEDTFPFNAEEWADNDEDGTGDNADTDDDNDGYLDADEIQCESDPLDSSSLPLDFDVDGAPDCIDDNDDNDYCLDVEDDFPLNRDLCVDTDGDGIDNRYEFDSDNDGVADTRDAFPLDPNESQDTDGDGIGDNEDQDDNNDGFSDEAPIISKVITPNQPGVESTWKIINIEDYPFTTVRVYTPDGSIVFESTNYQNQWRGNNMRTGSPLPTGPYYFRISYGSVLEKVEDGWLYIFN